jgi:serine/threonine protein kinase
LIYTHRNDIIHRDLKLSNIFIGENMQVKIGDYGLCTKVIDKSERKTTICGTPNYIAPEVLDGDRFHGHSFEVDIWSIGIIVYILLFGKAPFEGETDAET